MSLRHGLVGARRAFGATSDPKTYALTALSLAKIGELISLHSDITVIESNPALNSSKNSYQFISFFNRPVNLDFCHKGPVSRRSTNMSCTTITCSKLVIGFWVGMQIYPSGGRKRAIRPTSCSEFSSGFRSGVQSSPDATVKCRNLFVPVLLQEASSILKLHAARCCRVNWLTGIPFFDAEKNVHEKPGENMP